MAVQQNQFHCAVIGKEANTTTQVSAPFYDQAAGMAVQQLARAGALVDGDRLTVTKANTTVTLTYQVVMLQTTTWTLVDNT